MNVDDWKKSTKVLLGLATLWPVVYMFVFIGFFFLMFATFANAHSTHSEPPIWFIIIFPLHFLTILWSFGLIGIYIYHVFKTAAVAQDKKALWAVVIFLGNMVAMPIYFYLYIWKGPAPASPTQVSLPS
jgi:hypothetical protein